MKSIIYYYDKRYVELNVTSDKHSNDYTISNEFDNNLSPVINSDGSIAVQDKKLEVFLKTRISDKVSVMLFDNAEKKYVINAEDLPVLIASTDNAHISVDNPSVRILFTGTIIKILNGSVYLNGELVNAGEYPVDSFDCILVDSTKIVLSKENVVLSGKGYNCSLSPQWENSEMDEDFPEYKRSPRIIKKKPEKAVDIQAPETLNKKKNKLIKLILPPLVTMCITIAVSLLIGRGIMMLMGVSATAMTLIFSIVTFFSDKKEDKIKSEKREKDYSQYLLAKRKELDKLYNQQIEANLYHYPDPSTIADMVENHSSRIYERAATDSDFLTLSVGLAEQPITFSIKNKKETIGDVEDTLLKEMYNVIDLYKTVPDMPVAIDLKQAHLGIVGKHTNIKGVLFSLISQLCFHHSYHDIEIVTLVSDSDKSEFEWMKWYPHCKIKSINVSGVVSAENQRDQVLGNIAQILKERKQKQEESKQESLYLPHFVFVIDNPKMIINHSIMEYLQLKSMDLGFSIIYTTNIRANLPENIRTILTVDSQKEGTLLLNNGELLAKKLNLYDISSVNLERMARTLTPIQHNQGVSTQIPESITFFEMYGVKKPSEIPIQKLWQGNNCYKSLAVPLGVRAKDDIVYLNLHEKAHGPHGLVAGTTGSGKSEIVQSYILSLAINFHPYDVGFLLIDYKGGGMADLFAKLPHLLGTITNLDGSESMRALASIKSELARRQRIFRENNVNNINQYTKLFKAGKATQPLPHLFLISDEFAELKKEQPEFMSELVSAARIGRSLGVHLILATQKPSGVVDDQIWSNSKFKLALKVQNEADSNEVLKTPDAARITQVGRAYLQVGNNEIYELFQSAWSGAEYSEDIVEKGFDNRIYKINALGQGELLNEDLSEGETEQGVKKTQLDVVVEYIKDIYDSQHCENVEKPWLPPLEDKMVSPYVKDNGNVADNDDYNLSAAVGMVDIPEKQMQEEYFHDFLTDGNFAIFGSTGFGKSTVEMNIALTLACKNSPERLNYYILDFGTSSLIQLKGLPHTADYITIDETEKLDKFVNLITGEIKKRKTLFANTNAMNFKMYNNGTDNKIPAIIIIIDNYDVVREIGMEFEMFLTKLTRDGVSVGIYTIIDASRFSAVKYSVISNFKNKIVQYMFDHSDTIAVVGRSKYKLAEIKGRALVKLDDVSVMQCYLPVPFESDEAYSHHIGDLVENIAKQNTGKKPISIPMLPEIVTWKDVQQSDTDNKLLVVGLDTVDVQQQGINLNVPTHLVVGNAQTGKTNILKLACKQFEKSKVFIADSDAMDLVDCAEKENVVYFSNTQQLEGFMSSLEEAVSERENAFALVSAKMRLKDFCESQKPMLILIDDGDNFVELTKPVAKQMEELLKKATKYGATIITTTVPGKLRGFDNITKLLKDSQSGIILGNPSEQNIFTLPIIRNYKPQIDMGFIYSRGKIVNIKIPFVGR